MDIQQYISSGIIETYALGLASEADAMELVRLCDEHPEVRAALDDAQAVLERYAQKNAVTPPAGTKDKIWAAINEQQRPAATIAPATQPAAASAIAIPSATRNVIKIYRFAAAASIALLIGSIAYHMLTVDSYEQRITAMNKEQNSLLTQNTDRQNRIQQYQHDLQMVTDPAMQKVALMGTPAHADMKAMVYWDAQSKDVYLALNNLPKPPQGKQYQLWAIVDGKPVDAGMYNSNATELQKMKMIPSAQMFAITLENEGGSPAPTMDQMYVAGKV